MYDKGIVLDILRQIENSINIILKRFSKITEPDDFVESEEGLEKLDSICMQLIAIGESLKQIDKITEGKFLIKYPQVEWDKAKKMRDIIAHHYFDIDEEIVFNVCQKHLPLMLKVIQKMVKDLEIENE
ncbi:HepT-like ribonuclease domain-containing protein [Thermodesulfatator autotrophicus]|uniref:Antitoxin n=1 Tax=Thermodesulfatator autotrophicus TaxID=1795632 RepID=A0A177E5I5_9BACT|nr:HepT-like ribonuclease domain-containing protein [Thermodesulfatator autotrophicus]OAG27038.1 antitoxin [Thermodesulfatator autotrophicus]